MPTVSPEQLEKLRKIKQALPSAIYKYGELALQKRICETEMIKIEKEIEQHEVDRLAISHELKEQFGSFGTVQLETGEFISE